MKTQLSFKIALVWRINTSLMVQLVLLATAVTLLTTLGHHSLSGTIFINSEVESSPTNPDIASQTVPSLLFENTLKPTHPVAQRKSPRARLQPSTKPRIATLFNNDGEFLFQQLAFTYALHDFTLEKPMGSPQPYITSLSPLSVMTLAHQQRSTTDYRVVLDPGHGGSDPGTVGVDGLIEKELTLEIAHRVRELLIPHPNLSVTLTRDEDRGFSRENRLRHIQATKSDLLVSLHFNNLPQRDLTVVESFYADRENILESELERRNSEPASFVKASSKAYINYDYTTNSKRIAQILQRNIYQQVAQHNPAAVDAGVKNETLYTLTRSAIPSTLIELTCLSNSTEEQRLKSSAYRQRIAESIAEGLLEYFSTLNTVEEI